MEFVEGVLKEIGPCTVITGGARGVDAFAEAYARIHGWPEPHVYHPEWDKYRGRPGKNPAGVIRNQLIVDDSDVLLAFWYNDSPGTKDCIAKAKKKGIEVFVFIYEDGVFKYGQF